MKYTSDPIKRQTILDQRGFDMDRDAPEVFAGKTLTVEDDRKDYGESRFITIGRFIGRMVVLVWTPREGERRMISMRKANDREEALYKDRLD